MSEEPRALDAEVGLSRPRFDAPPPGRASRYGYANSKPAAGGFHCIHCGRIFHVSEMMGGDLAQDAAERCHVIHCWYHMGEQ